MPQGHTPLGAIHYWGLLWGAHFTVCRKREMLLGGERDDVRYLHEMRCPDNLSELGQLAIQVYCFLYYVPNFYH